MATVQQQLVEAQAALEAARREVSEQQGSAAERQRRFVVVQVRLWRRLLLGVWEDVVRGMAALGAAWRRLVWHGSVWRGRGGGALGAARKEAHMGRLWKAWAGLGWVQETWSVACGFAAQEGETLLCRLHKQARMVVCGSLIPLACAAAIPGRVMDLAAAAAHGAPRCCNPALLTSCLLACLPVCLQSSFKKREREMEDELASLRQAMEAAQLAAAEAAQRAGQAQQEAQAAAQDRCRPGPGLAGQRGMVWLFMPAV